MAFQVRAIFEDGSSKILKYTHSYELAISCLVMIADRRMAYAELIPLMKSVQVVCDDKVAFAMQVERNVQPSYQPKDNECLATDAKWSSTTGQSCYVDRHRDTKPLSSNVLSMSAHRLPVGELDMLARWEPSESAQAGFHSGLDNEAHAIRVMGSGVWRETHAERYFDQQRRIVDQARCRFGPLKISFDVRNWIVENPQSALQFQEVNRELYRPEDRLVAIVRSPTDTEHPKVALSGSNTEVFTSLSMAETWLHATALSG